MKQKILIACLIAIPFSSFSHSDQARPVDPEKEATLFEMPNVLTFGYRGHLPCYARYEVEMRKAIVNYIVNAYTLPFTIEMDIKFRKLALDLKAEFYDCVEFTYPKLK
ncbi:MAG: hypothetical protein ABIV51_13620 [Saprospiraceae bacterium]